MEVEMEIIPAVKSEEIENTASGFAAGPSTSAPRNRGPAEVIVVSDDDDEGGDSDESDDLTPEERVELARLQVSSSNQVAGWIIRVQLFLNVSSHRLKSKRQVAKGKESKRLGPPL